ncbi:LysR substrate-binding domain-containing protein [Streptomyces sp. NPDC102462]|uniref:LysR substrate-binding domain-containing protein n=1 Tax=Streptomyces sp. NPDC102462 TaxID=3366178 RepID=UPI00382213ED
MSASAGPDGPLTDAVEARGEAPYAALARGADMAVSSSPPPSGLTTRTVGHPPLWVYAPEDHPWHRDTGRTTVDLAELLAQPLLLLPVAEYGTRRILDRAAEEANLGYSEVFETTTPPLAQALAAAGHGVAVASEDQRHAIEPLRLRGPDGSPLTMTLTAAWEPTHYAADHLAAFAEGLAAYCESAYPPHR